MAQHTVYFNYALVFSSSILSYASFLDWIVVREVGFHTALVYILIKQTKEFKMHKQNTYVPIAGTSSSKYGEALSLMTRKTYGDATIIDDS